MTIHAAVLRLREPAFAASLEPKSCPQMISNQSRTRSRRTAASDGKAASNSSSLARLSVQIWADRCSPSRSDSIVVALLTGNRFLPGLNDSVASGLRLDSNEETNQPHSV